MRLLLAAILAGMMSMIEPVAAQPWPSRPVKVVDPFGPGTTTDAGARALVAESTLTFGQPFAIVKKGGAGGADGAIGATELVLSAPDGYTLMVGSNSSSVVVP